MAETRKIFVLDTSVVIHDPQCIQTFGDNDVVVPLALISEIDGFKTGEDQKGFNAREFSRETAGQIVKFTGAKGMNPEEMEIMD